MKKYRNTLTALCLCLAVFTLFGGTIGHKFNSDDYLAIYHASNDLTISPSDAFSEFTKPSWGLYYRPIIKFFFEMLTRSFGLWAGGYHAVGLICYALLCLEVYFIALLLTGKWPASVAAAVIFMTSGSHGEALFWISSLNGVVENIITLAAFTFFILWRQQNQKSFYMLSLVLFIFALLTKESAISLPILLVLYDFLLGGEVRWGESIKRTAKSCWPFAVAGLAFVLLRAIVMREAHLPPPLVTFQWRMILAGPWYSVVMTLSPIDWSRALQWFDIVAKTRAILYVLIAIILSALVIVPLALKRYRVAFLALWILAAAAPLFALGLVPSERHVVVSSAGASVLLSVLFFRLSEKIARKSDAMAIGMGFVLVVAFVLPGCVFLKQKQNAWKHASIISSDVIEQTMVAYPQPAESTTFFFLNVPDSIDGALVFRFDNIRLALRLYYEDETIDAVRIVTLDKVPSGATAGWEGIYFTIAAMGGNVYVPMNAAEGAEQPAQWQELSRMGILGKNFRYIDNWERYRSSPFLVYSRDGLMPQPSGELKTVVGSLYSLR
jgi:hypothetical protein